MSHPTRMVRTMRPMPELDVFRAIAAIGDEAVLVCGQAIAWWARYYARIKRFDLDASHSAFVSQDVNVVPASLERGQVRAFLRRIAGRLGGRSEQPRMVFGSRIAGSVSKREAATLPREDRRSYRGFRPRFLDGE